MIHWARHKAGFKRPSGYFVPGVFRFRHVDPPVVTVNPALDYLYFSRRSIIAINDRFNANLKR